MDSKNTHLLLFSVVFLLLGCLLGRMTVPHHAHPRPGKHKGMRWMEGVQLEGHDIDLRVLTDEDLEGDTIIALPGVGQVNVTRNGEEIEVEVKADQAEAIRDGGRAVIVIKAVTGDSVIRVEKRVMMVTSDDQRNSFDHP
jgi:hypothetical protein